MKRNRVPVIALVSTLATTFAFGLGCKKDSEEAEGTGAATAPAAPAPTPAPAAEPLSPLPPAQFDARKAELGRRLFHDGALSGDGTISCSTCHSLDHGGAEPRRTSTGIRGQVGPINSPTVLNSVHNFVQFWDGRAANLLEQAAGPVSNPIEMDGNWETILQRLGQDAAYRDAFAAAYPDGITQANTLDAIVEYEKSLVTPSRFDRYLAGETGAITDAERRGYETFKSVGCTSCHLGVNVGGSMYQRMGLVRDYFAERGSPTPADDGRFAVTRDEADRHVFKVPTLRNIELTAPYLHDGTQQTLPDVVRVMGRYQLGRELTAEQVDSIVAFLRSLTGQLPASARMPAAPAAPAAPPTTMR